MALWGTAILQFDILIAQTALYYSVLQEDFLQLTICELSGWFMRFRQNAS